MLTTNTVGFFSMEHTFTSVGPHKMRASFDGNDFLRPAQVEETLQIITVDIETDIPSTLVRGETTTVGGRLTLADAPRAGEAVTLMWDGQQVAEIFSQNDGLFSYDLPIDSSESLETHRLTISVPGFQEETDVEVAVKARTSLLVAGPLEGHPDDSLTFKETLLDDQGGPVSQATISLDDHAISGLTTDEGIATLSFHIPEEPGVDRLSLAFRFEENEKYMGSLALLSLAIVPPGGGLLPWIMAFLAVTALALGGGFYYYRWRRDRLGPTPPLLPSQTKRRLKTTLYIELPQIVSPLPLVWGLGEPLDIRITLRDENQMPVPQRALEVSLGGHQVEAETDTEGVCNLQHGFNVKGGSAISVRFREDSEYKGTSQQVSLRIVYYREEVVQLYNDSLQGFRRKGVHLPRESTPREAEELVRRQWGSETEAAVSQMVENFEVADYSLHDILRASYTSMYMACLQLTERGDPVDEITV